MAVQTIEKAAFEETLIENIEPQMDKKDPFTIEQLIPRFDEILKEDHNLLRQLSKTSSDKNDDKKELENVNSIMSKHDNLLKRLAQ